MVRSEDGFTLIEVLIALAVLAIALAAVMRLLAQSVDLSAGLRDRTIALGVAQDQLVQHYIKRDWPSPDTRTGTRDQGGRVWHWEEKVIATPVPDFRRIEISVRDDHEQQFAHLVGFLSKPTGSSLPQQTGAQTGAGGASR